MSFTSKVMRTKYEVNWPNSFGENVQKLANDHFNISHLDIQDGYSKFRKLLCLTQELILFKYEVNMPDICGRNVQKLQDTISKNKSPGFPSSA